MPTALRLLPLLAVLATLAAFALPSAAAAVETGTPAWLVNGQVLRAGPGAAYDVTDELGGEARIRVDRCTYRWCQVRADGARGWVSRDDVNFGQHPRGPLTGPRLDYGSGGTVCFYEGRDFTGDHLCAGAGAVVHDLLITGLDDRFASILIEDTGSVTVCRDRNFSSYCERIIESTPVLPGFLENAISSYRVH